MKAGFYRVVPRNKLRVDEIYPASIAGIVEGHCRIGIQNYGRAVCQYIAALFASAVAKSACQRATQPEAFNNSH